MRLVYNPHFVLTGTISVFSCVVQHASEEWPDCIPAHLESQPALGTQLVAVTSNERGSAMARIRGAWLVTDDGLWDPSNRRMPWLVLAAARALAILISKGVTTEEIERAYSTADQDHYAALKAILEPHGLRHPEGVPETHSAYLGR